MGARVADGFAAPAALPPARRARIAGVLGALALAGLLGIAVPGHATDASRPLRVVFPIAETGFDPQALSDTYSAAIINAIFDPLYRYDYFARPMRLEPNTADGPPQISADGRVYTIKVRRGIWFPAHPAFKGRRRELDAYDYVYSWKRILDPKVRSYDVNLFEGRLVGADEALAAARRTGDFDYDAKIEGLQATDARTIVVRFRNPEFGFRWWLTTPNLAAVAREVVEAKRDASHRVMEDPVGTGPYRLKSWVRGQKIVLEANPDFRDLRFPAPDTGDAADAAIARGLAGRRLPLTREVEIAIVEEAQARMLTFDTGAFDTVEVPSSIATNYLDGAKLRPEFARRGIALHRSVEPSLSFFFFNLDDPLVGGYTPERIALRRAVALAYDGDAAIRLLNQDQALVATQPIPPGLDGYDPAYRSPARFDPAAARALLDRMGYRDRDGDGYRENPDGTPLTLVKGSTPDAASRASDELWKKSMDAVGLRITFLKNKWPELNRLTENGQLMMWGLGWIASVPDGGQFYSYLYSPNIGTSNDARLRLPEYDALYVKARALPAGPERALLYRKMNDVIFAYAPWILANYPYRNVLVQPWLKGYKPNPFRLHQFEYYALDPVVPR